MGLGRALAARPLSTVTAPQYELALGSESEPAAMIDGLKDKPHSLTGWTPTCQQAIHRPSTSHTELGGRHLCQCEEGFPGWQEERGSRYACATGARG